MSAGDAADGNLLSRPDGDPPRFVGGAELCRRFYEDVLRALVGVEHSAGLLGPGSDVLGYDTPRSTDHDWGPRGLLLVEPGQVTEVRSRVAAGLPERYGGWPVAIGRDGRPKAPAVVVTTLGAWTAEQFGLDLTSSRLQALDWLTFPQQRLLGVVRGPVFADDSGQLTKLRARLAWYPDDVWWWMLAVQWRRLAQEEPLVQRTAEVGDHLGSFALSGGLVRDCMRLALLIDRQYAPYTKWLGTAFAGLQDRDGLRRRLGAALRATSPRERERHLGGAYQALARRHNAIHPGEDLDVTLRRYHDRPAHVLGADRFVESSLERVGDPELVSAPLIGAIDQWVNSTDVLTHPTLCRRLRSTYTRP